MPEIDVDINGEAFDPTLTGFKLLPAKVYRIEVIEADVKPTKDNSADYVEMQMVVLDEGDFFEALIIDRVNYQNANQDVRNRAINRLREYSRAFGIVGSTFNTDLFVGKQGCVKLGINPPRVDQKTGKSYPAGNDVKGVGPLGDFDAMTSAFEAELATLKAAGAAEPREAREEPQRAASGGYTARRAAEATGAQAPARTQAPARAPVRGGAPTQDQAPAEAQADTPADAPVAGNKPASAPWKNRRQAA